MIRGGPPERMRERPHRCRRVDRRRLAAAGWSPIERSTA
ncbi:hypothetical protein D779_0131 [Imhoffiella purpurea]|uniref:Uncharacterized protein n=1 Tax=Imhoffiella purpurea TaxID=1249627 RepID=W9W1P5_9GAMM|nr:hypothetical protein D779_0131 [Imhoffiella purpurea]